MPILYSPIGSTIKPYQLTEADLLQIGRLVAGCAELEDIIDLYFSKITEISEAYAFVLFGRTSASAKVKMIETIAKAKGGEAWETHKDCFLSEGYLDVIKCRNTVAHGTLLGITEEGNIAFQVKEVAGASETEVKITVLAYPPEGIADCAQAVWKSLPKVEERLGLKALREKRRARSLEPHHKAQFRAKKGEEPQPPPPTSAA